MSKSRSKKKEKKFDPNKVAEIDPKTQAVFLKKGYKVETMLGAGSFGEVYKGVRLSTGELCAVKMMNLLKMSSKFKQRFLPRELATLMEIKHENIIRVWDIFRSNGRIYVFMEYAANGDLARYLKQFGVLTEARSRVWFGHIATAINYLHEELYTAHRDIKIDNILLSESWVAKLTDFGFATDATSDAEGKAVLSETFCGTLPYYSPQIVSRKPYSPFKADVWAHGVVLYAMTHNKFPFHFKDTKLMIREQMDLDYRTSRLDRHLSADLQDLLLHMLEPDEQERFSFGQVLAHAWLFQDGYIDRSAHLMSS